MAQFVTALASPHKPDDQSLDSIPVDRCASDGGCRVHDIGPWSGLPAVSYGVSARHAEVTILAEKIYFRTAGPVAEWGWWGAGSGGPMQRFVAKANVDHFIGLLNGSDLTPDKRKDITKLLIAELDKLAHDLEHLEFAERKAAEGRERVNHVKDIRNGHSFGTTGREQAELPLISCENLQTVLEDFCHRLRERINSRGI